MIGLLVGSIALLAYVFVGYPAIVALLARLRARPLVTDVTYEPTVTVVVLAYNEADVIKERLRNISELDYPSEKVEVIVAADGSDDDTVARANEVAGTRVLHERQRHGKQAAMQRAAEAATGEILVFTDANNLYTPETLREIVAPFADRSVGVVSGRKAIDDGHGRPLDKAEGLYWRYESRLKTWESECGSVAGVAGEILAFRPEAFPSSGRWLNEDFAQALQAAIQGWRVVYAPRAVSLEQASATLEDEATRRSRLVTGRFQAIFPLLPSLVRRQPWFACQVVSHKGLRPLVPWLLLTAAVSNLAASTRRPWTRASLLFQAVFYLAAVAGWRDERKGRRKPAVYLAYYFCRMNFASFNGLWNFVRRKYEMAWPKVTRA